MADFPIYQSQRSLPGVAPNVEANLDVRTGKGQEFAAMSQFGATLGQVGQQMYQMQGEVELARAQNEDADAINKMFLGFEKNLDPETYAQEYQSTLSEIENREVKNGWAVRRRNINLARAKPGWEFDVDKAAIAKTIDNWEHELALKKVRAIDTGILTDYSATAWRGLKLGATKEDIEFQIDDAAHKAELEAARKYALASPDEALEDLKDNKLEGAVTLKANDLLRIRNMAVMKRADNKAQFKEAQLEYMNGLWGIGTNKKATVDDAIKYINAAPEGLLDKRKALSQFAEMHRIIASGGGNPLLVRQDQGAYWDLIRRATKGDATELDFAEAVNKSQITVKDYEHLVGVIRRESGATGTTFDYVSDALDDTFSTLQGIRTANIKEMAEVDPSEEEQRKTEAEIASSNVRLLRMKHGLLQHFEENPDLSPEQIDSHIQKTMNPVKEDIASELVEEAVKGPGLLRRHFTNRDKEPFEFIGGGGFGGGYAGVARSIGTRQWNAFDEAIQKQVIKALELGYTWEEIKAADEVKPFLVEEK